MDLARMASKLSGQKIFCGVMAAIRFSAAAQSR
jgi:hypothetical protein